MKESNFLHIFKHWLQMIPAVYILGNFNVGHGLTLYGITNTIDLCQSRIS